MFYINFDFSKSVFQKFHSQFLHISCKNLIVKMCEIKFTAVSHYIIFFSIYIYFFEMAQDNLEDLNVILNSISNRD